MKILVVDDEDPVRELVKDAMVEQGYQVSCATNGQEALDLATGIEFDLVFCDVVMNGMSGFEVLRSFRGTLRSQAEIVLMTGQASVDAAIDNPGANGAASPVSRNSQPNTHQREKGFGLKSNSQLYLVGA